MLLCLQKGIVYGPVMSRRLGRSLGINLLPPERKVCTLDCAYCQYGWTDPEVLRTASPQPFPAAGLVTETIALALVRLPQPPAYITFSGNGEATLHPEFPRLAAEVTTLRDRYAPAARTAILSNSTTVHRPEIRTALALLDERIMKLDAGEEAVFRRFNRPAPGLTLEQVVRGLEALPGVTIQTLFAGGPLGNAGPEAVEAWLGRISRISPVNIQVYTLDRGYPEPGLEELPRETLEGIAARVRRLGLAAEVF